MANDESDALDAIEREAKEYDKVRDLLLYSTTAANYKSKGC
jgi:hypothetical protein